jgi:hypothetical protein
MFLSVVVTWPMHPLWKYTAQILFTPSLHDRLFVSEFHVNYVYSYWLFEMWKFWRLIVFGSRQVRGRKGGAGAKGRDGALSWPGIDHGNPEVPYYNPRPSLSSLTTISRWLFLHKINLYFIGDIVHCRHTCISVVTFVDQEWQTNSMLLKLVSPCIIIQLK